MAGDEYEIDIDQDGKVTVRTVGIKGPRCVDCAELFARIIGPEESRELTTEYYEAASENQQKINVRDRR